MCCGGEVLRDGRCYSIMINFGAAGLSMSKTGLGIAGLFAVVISFVITFWSLTDNHRLNWNVTDEVTLAAAAAAAGYRTSADMGGNVDTLVRLDTQKVIANGWAADTAGDGSPLTLNAFARGSNIAVFWTDGARPDITAGFIANYPKANPDRVRNTKFITTFSCTAGAKLLVVVTSTNKRYAWLKPHSLVCP